MFCEGAVTKFRNWSISRQKILFCETALKFEMSVSEENPNVFL